MKQIVLIDLKGQEAFRLPAGEHPIPGTIYHDQRNWAFGVAKLNGEQHFYQVSQESPPMGNPMDRHNPNCDGDQCVSRAGEVRVLPSCGDSNLILCRACFAYEMVFRRERNRDLSPDCAFQLPEWSTLKVYVP